MGYIFIGISIGMALSFAIDTCYLLDKYYFERKYGRK